MPTLGEGARLEADLEDSEQVEREPHQHGGDGGDEGGLLELEAPADGVPSAAQRERSCCEREHRELDASAVGDTMLQRLAATLTRELADREHLHREHRQHTRH